MKNFTKMMAMLVLVTVMSVNSTFAGVYLTDRGGNQETPVCTNGSGDTINGGVILSGVILSGVILSGVILSGVILSAIDETPCTVLGSTDV